MSKSDNEMETSREQKACVIGFTCFKQNPSMPKLALNLFRQFNKLWVEKIKSISID